MQKSAQYLNFQDPDSAGSIEWATHTWNPFTGCNHLWNPVRKCRDGTTLRVCEYCYAFAMADRLTGTKAFPNGFHPTYHPERIKAPIALKKPAVIFTGSMTDLFGDFIPYWIVNEIHDTMINKAPQHEYVILTKNPERMLDYLTDDNWNNEFPKNVHYGITLDYAKSGTRAPLLADLASHGYNTVVSFEPLLEMPFPGTLNALKEIGWLIMGAQTNPNVPPPPFAIERIYDFAFVHGIPLLPKRNLPDISIQFKTSEAYERIISHPRFPIPIGDIMQKWGKP